MGTNIGFASSPADEVSSVAQQVALSEVQTQDVPIPASLPAIAALTPLAWDDTANAYKVWAVGDKVAAIACYDIPDSASLQRAAVYISGQFNIDAINWPAGTTEANVLDGQNPSRLSFRKLLFSDKRISVDGSNLVGPTKTAPVTG